MILESACAIKETVSCNVLVEGNSVLQRIGRFSQLAEHFKALANHPCYTSILINAHLDSQQLMTSWVHAIGLEKKHKCAFNMW